MIKSWRVNHALSCALSLARLHVYNVIVILITNLIDFISFCRAQNQLNWKIHTRWHITEFFFWKENRFFFCNFVCCVYVGAFAWCVQRVYERIKWVEKIFRASWFTEVFDVETILDNKNGDRPSHTKQNS